ncbi:YcgN family cysteine cluster protein [uncultured Tateyamaria sp.]|uniref:YcgN family cysteine cluster protein n=1 Tax=uncultured Tateyamaria sp. TaxID=455651 RepID=UPI002627430E|nr:YcgN family cysteine cluster protein [uncultured Tateyamaria sp.]
MSDPIERSGFASRFWETKRLDQMSEAEWEALCDGCGKCCLNKLEDEDSGDVALTRVACRLLDDATCRCAQYDIRHQFVPDCIVLKPSNIESHLYWMPQTCAYRLLHEGKGLADWHPLISGTPETVHAAGVSMRGRTYSEFDVADDDWEDHIIEEPT